MRLRRAIVRSELQAGEALPSEGVLMAQLGVSRPTLREAYRVLEAEGLITIRRGAHGGARVLSPQADVAARYAGLVLEHRGATLADVYTAGAVLEGAVVGSVAAHAERHDLAPLHRALEAERREPSDTSRREFHVELVATSGNDALLVVTGLLRRLLEWAHPDRLGRCTAAEVGDDGAHPAHEGVVQLMSGAAPRMAEQLWRDHLLALGAPIAAGGTTGLFFGLAD
jgi:DNA-binding FadR family transcriptional regulator